MKVKGNRKRKDFWIQRMSQRVWYQIRMFFQKLFRGYSDNEWWDFQHACAKWSLPRLKALKAHSNNSPCEDSGPEGEPVAIPHNEWQEIIQTMINAFQCIYDDNDWSNDAQTIINLGLDNFRKYYQTLWD